MLKIKYLAVFTTILLLVACSSRPPVTSGLGSELIHPEDSFTQRLVADNPNLSKQLKITDIKTRQTNDLLEVNLQLTSYHNKSLKLQYHFNWFDAQGFIVESQKTPWKAIELHGMQTVLLRGVAPKAEAESFNLYVREVATKAYNY